jgi:hypothetical protein
VIPLDQLSRGALFYEARKALGLSWEGTADFLRLGVHGHRTIRRWEKNEKDIPGPVLVLIAKCLREQGHLKLAIVFEGLD